MSYILDALRKSDQQRQHGVAPTLSSAPIISPTSAYTQEKTAWLPIGLLSIALIGTGVTIGWLRPWQQDEAAPAPAAISAKPAITAPVPAIAPATVVQTTAKAEPAAPKVAGSETVKTGDRPRFSEENRGRSPVLVPPIPSPISKPQPPSQPELPNVSITVHAYSANPRERIAGINRRLLHEGDEVAPGLKLEQITEDGVILSFRGRRFRRGLH
ncbi:MAG: hypothetical protein H6R18_1523 [Proteobacteria bacterium]|nr:hypothetical protein [Pseudomonadota bacterium]